MGFGEITPADIEKEWRAWIVKQPPVPQREDRLALPQEYTGDEEDDDSK